MSPPPHIASIMALVQDMWAICCSDVLPLGATWTETSGEGFNVGGIIFQFGEYYPAGISVDCFAAIVGFCPYRRSFGYILS